MLKIKKYTAIVVTMCIALCSCGNNVQENTGNTSDISENISETQPATSDSSNNSETRDVFAMDTYMSLKAYGDDVSEALDTASKRIYELENILSVTSDTSDIWKINNSAGQKISVSDDTLNILNAAILYGDDTDGALDITVYPVLKLWGFTTGEYRVPKAAEISELLKKVDYKNVNIQDNEINIPEEVQIDLGALAKGYTGDEVMKTLKSCGVESAIISLGGNVQALGLKPDGSQWTVAVKNPFFPDSDMCIVKIENKAVITSGNYERYFKDDKGNLYWHIIDPNSGYPADNGLVSVTIIGENGLMCDSLSTALFVMGTEKAIDYWKSKNTFDMILVTDDKKIYYTEGIADSFQNTSNIPTEVLTIA